MRNGDRALEAGGALSRLALVSRLSMHHHLSYFSTSWLLMWRGSWVERGKQGFYEKAESGGIRTSSFKRLPEIEALALACLGGLL
jgi:hypothetical protein